MSYAVCENHSQTDHCGRRHDVIVLFSEQLRCPICHHEDEIANLENEVEELRSEVKGKDEKIGELEADVEQLGMNLEAKNDGTLEVR